MKKIDAAFMRAVQLVVQLYFKRERASVTEQKKGENIFHFKSPSPFD